MQDPPPSRDAASLATLLFVAGGALAALALLADPVFVGRYHVR